MDAPLKGIKVLELGTHVAVPSACRLMAEYGADVIKIETAGGDPWRYSGLNVNLTIDDFSCPVFTIQNNGKRLISLDLKTEGGRAVFMKLLENTDVFCTSVRMKGLAKMGLDYDTLKKKFPKLIYFHFTGYGHRGPDAEAPGFDIASFWSRVGARVGWVGKVPSPSVPPVAMATWSPVCSSSLVWSPPCGVVTSPARAPWSPTPSLAPVCGSTHSPSCAHSPPTTTTSPRT